MIEPLRVLRTTPQLTAYIPFVVLLADIRKVMGPGLAELKAAVAAQNIPVTGPWFTHHVRNPGMALDFEICLPVATPVAPVNRVKSGQWPATLVVQTTYRGGFENLGVAWGEFMAQIKAAGHKVADGLWERYLVGPEMSADPTVWQTELNKPLASS